MLNDSPYAQAETEDGYAVSGIWQSASLPRLAKYPAVRALQAGHHVIYALRLRDGIIKIGCCKDLANRSSGLGGQILAFREGDFAEELEIHRSLIEHRAHGREYYHPVPAVIAVVNEMRQHFDLPPLEAA